MQQLAFTFEVRRAKANPGKRRRGLRLEGRPRRRDLKPANLPIGYQPAYRAKLAAALAYPVGTQRARALASLAALSPAFDLAEDLADEAAELSWGALAHAARADQAAE